MDTGLHRGGSSSTEIFEMSPTLMTYEQWSMICNDALSISSRFKALSNEVINEDWYAEDFDLRTSHCPWERSLLSLPELDSSPNSSAQYNFLDLSGLSFGTGVMLGESQLNSTMMNSNLMLDMDDSLTVIQLLKTPPQRDASFTISKNNASYTISKTNESPINNDCHSLTAAELLKTPPKHNVSYTVIKANDSFIIAKPNESFTVGKNNASYTISNSPVDISPVPSSASKNSSFSEVAEKFHSLRRSMSSDSVMPLSQEKIRTMSLTARALVPTQPPPQAGSVFSAAVADMRLRPGRAPLVSKGPMRAMLPLGQMMRAAPEETIVVPAAKKHCPQNRSSTPSPNTSAMRPAAISTPLSKRTTPRRSISMSPVRRATPVRSPSSGYGQRKPSEPVVSRGRLTFAVKDFGASGNATTIVNKKPTGTSPKPAPTATTGSRLKWPTARGVFQSSSLPKPIAASKGIPSPVLLASDPNVRISRLKAPSRATYGPLPSVKGKENRF